MNILCQDGNGGARPRQTGSGGAHTYLAAALARIRPAAAAPAHARPMSGGAPPLRFGAGDRRPVGSDQAEAPLRATNGGCAVSHLGQYGNPGPG